MKITALYIHIPFCDQICIYCDFYKMKAKEEKKEKYLRFLLKDLEQNKNLLRDIETIYLGGGTPGSLSPQLLDNLFSLLISLIDFKKVTEFTVECNPDNINPALIAVFRKYGVNRISLGVQSLNDRKLAFLQRHHTASAVIDAIRLLRKNGLMNINCDLIYGLDVPGCFADSKRLLKKDLKKLLREKITHLSCYTLIPEEKTILIKMIEEKICRVLSDDEEADLFDFINAFLKKHGFIHYEVSNYARPGYQSRHNLCYWNNGNYLGIGAGASGYIGNVRYTIVRNLNRYFRGVDTRIPATAEKSVLSPREEMKETVMLGLRKLSGINKKDFEERFREKLTNAFPEITDLLKRKILIDDGENIGVGENRIYLLNSILTAVL